MLYRQKIINGIAFTSFAKLETHDAGVKIYKSAFFLYNKKTFWSK
jgi:hypothetical protein